MTQAPHATGRKDYTHPSISVTTQEVKLRIHIPNSPSVLTPEMLKAILTREAKFKTTHTTAIAETTQARQSVMSQRQKLRFHTRPSTFVHTFPIANDETTHTTANGEPRTRLVAETTHGHCKCDDKGGEAENSHSQPPQCPHTSHVARQRHTSMLFPSSQAQQSVMSHKQKLRFHT